MPRQKKKSLIIPCYNEEPGLREILGNDFSLIDEVVVVDNNSTDKTTEVAKNFGARVVPEKKQGYGWAYRAGLAAAQGEIIIALDGDNSYSMKEALRLAEKLSQNKLDFISGCRFPLRNKKAMSFLNRWGNYFLTIAFVAITGKKIKDSQSGLWVFRRAILAEMSLRGQGMEFSEEIKMEALFNPKIRFAEMPINYHERWGEIKLRKWRDGLVNLLFLFVKSRELKRRFRQKNDEF